MDYKNIQQTWPLKNIILIFKKYTENIIEMLFYHNMQVYNINILIYTCIYKIYENVLWKLDSLNYINPFKLGNPQKGNWQTVNSLIRCRRMWHLISLHFFNEIEFV